MRPEHNGNLPPILPVGTQVVVHQSIQDSAGVEQRAAGSVGVVERSPMDLEHPYGIRFPDGEIASVNRFNLEVLSHHKDSVIETPRSSDMFSHVVYRCIVGSQAFGLDEDTSDVDIRGVFLPPASLHWSLAGTPNFIERSGVDECYWELERFLVLALKANPNILECLFTPCIELTTAVGEELIDIRSSFLSRFIFKTYNGYVLSQFKKLNNSRVDGGNVKWKHAMHLIRLLISGIGVLKTGKLQLDVGSDRRRLLDVKHGRLSWREVDTWRLSLQREFDEAGSQSPLPERPDYERVNRFLIDARRAMVDVP